MEIMICFIIDVFFIWYLYDENWLLILSQEYYINGKTKCSCQQTAGYSKQTALDPGYVVCIDVSRKIYS